jgi:hypothetical protein
VPELLKLWTNSDPAMARLASNALYGIDATALAP